MQTGLLGTVTSIVGGEARPVERTTPEAIDLQRTFREMLDAGDVACAMEISSHALELRRAEGIHCAAAVFTNLSQDHLDFHPDMESYFLAKRRLFETDPGRADRVRRRSLRAAPGRASSPARVTFGIDAEADVRALDVRPDAAGSDFTLRTRRRRVAGAARAAGALQRAQRARRVGGGAGARRAARAAARHARASRPRVPGRFEPVDEGQPFAVVVDYAHKPGALENVLHVGARDRRGPRDRRVRRRRRPRPRQAPADGGDRGAARRPGDRHLRQPALGGPGGDRRRGRRPGARGGQVEREVDRRAAIARAVELARPGDIVVIAGKGHEQGQEFEGGRKEPFDDVTRGPRGAAGRQARA